MSSDVPQYCYVCHDQAGIADVHCTIVLSNYPIVYPQRSSSLLHTYLTGQKSKTTTYNTHDCYNTVYVAM